MIAAAALARQRRKAERRRQKAVKKLARFDGTELKKAAGEH
jgi:hypothetical protein